jgi:precorrin-4 methylase
MAGWCGFVDRLSVEVGEVDRDQILRLLGEREAAGRAEVVRLEQEAARITGLIEECRREVERLAIAREVLSGLVAGPVGAAPAEQDLKPDAVSGDQLLAVLAGSGQPVRCRDVVAALGEDPSVARRVEGVRHRLKKLVAAGRVAEPQPGLFTLAGGSGPSSG